MDQPTAIDLFAGAGGATQGLTDAGLRVVAAVENDASASATYALNHPGTNLVVDDIRKVDVASLRKRLGLKKGELTLLKSCPPCQGFSSLGRRRPQDPRNDLVHQTSRFIAEFQPQSILLENVPGLRHDDRFNQIVSQTSADGYGIASYTVDASQFGVPQHRRRLIVIAVEGQSPSDLPTELSDFLPDWFDTTPRTAGEALGFAGPIDGSDPVHRARTPRPKTLERIMEIPVGGNRFDLSDEQSLTCHSSLTTRSATSSYGRIVANALAPTMTTRCTTPACGRFIHPTEHRGISLREAALLQTFPPGYQFAGGYDSIERQIGNAVPVRMAEALGRIVLACLPANDGPSDEVSNRE